VRTWPLHLVVLGLAFGSTKGFAERRRRGASA
jgi:hypothetical protein